uniref:Uncharacterized protein n=1 Tax=Arion vulgaris TaxID=1028688 RepID=A0A0B6ZT76_9EUPU
MFLSKLREELQGLSNVDLPLHCMGGLERPLVLASHVNQSSFILPRLLNYYNLGHGPDIRFR